MENKRRRRSAADSKSRIPADVTIEFISRLPAKDLMPFTCVSKSWLSLISTDSHLSKLQLRRRTTSSDPPLVILQRVNRQVPGANSWEFYNYSFRLDSLEDPNNIGWLEIHNPFSPPRRDADVVASCDGLVVLELRHTRSLALSNPTTGKYHLVPPNPAGDGNAVFSGVGYDKDRECYKLLVTIINPDENDNLLELMVYDINGTWRKIQSEFGRLFWYGDNDFNVLNYPGCYVNGALYMEFKMEDDSDTILGFDLHEEKFFDVKSPEFGDILYEGIEMVKFDERLCLICMWRGNDEIGLIFG